MYELIERVLVAIWTDEPNAADDEDEDAGADVEDECSGSSKLRIESSASNPWMGWSFISASVVALDVQSRDNWEEAEAVVGEVEVEGEEYWAEVEADVSCSNLREKIVAISFREMVQLEMINAANVGKEASTVRLDI